MLDEWIRRAIEKGGGNQADIARKVSARLGRKLDRSIVQKMAAGERNITGEELLALSEVSGLPVPGGAPAVAPAAAVDPATILRLISESFQAFGRSARQADFLAAAIVTIATSPNEIESLQTDADYAERFRALIDQARRAAP